jgi:molybdopterin-guanine dinucleotide biosynthesis protein A
MVAAILAGGASRRMGTPKAALRLGDRTLLERAVVTAREAGLRPVVVAKPGMALPAVEAERWDEPDEPRHPLTGIVHALERAGAPVLVCAVDMPWVTADACRSLLDAAPGGVAAVAVGAGEMCPVLGVYAPDTLDVLRAASPDAPLRDTVAALDPVRVALPPPLLRSVNEPADLSV